MGLHPHDTRHLFLFPPIPGGEGLLKNFNFGPPSDSAVWRILDLQQWLGDQKMKTDRHDFTADINSEIGQHQVSGGKVLESIYPGENPEIRVYNTHTHLCCI